MANGRGSAGAGPCPRAAVGPPWGREAPGAQREGSRAGGIIPNLRGWGWGCACLSFPTHLWDAPGEAPAPPGLVLSPPRWLLSRAQQRRGLPAGVSPAMGGWAPVPPCGAASSRLNRF